MNKWFHRLGRDERLQRRAAIAVGILLAILVVLLIIVLIMPVRGKNGGDPEASGIAEEDSSASGPGASEMSDRDTSEFSGRDASDVSDFSIKSDSTHASGSSIVGMVDSLGTTVRDDAHGMGEIAAETGSDPYRDKPDIDITSWEFILANPWNDIGDYTPALATLEGQQFDERIIDAMKAFVQGARDEGLSVVLSSGYRSYETQTYLFNRKVAQYGEEVAATIVARPGTSEHQTGLCCDITDQYYEMKDESLENTALYQWMSKHCQEYGFIVRFPKGKQDITGIIYEPWHFRYVGVEAATYIMENDLTLEEFLDLYR